VRRARCGETARECAVPCLREAVVTPGADRASDLTLSSRRCEAAIGHPGDGQTVKEVASQLAGVTGVDYGFGAARARGASQYIPQSVFHKTSERLFLRAPRPMGEFLG